jgi:hypothetical protein
MALHADDLPPYALLDPLIVERMHEVVRLCAAREFTRAYGLADQVMWELDGVV